MRAEELIELARDLARRDAGRPKSVSLRKAASSAYYALFHALAYMCADRLVGWRKPYPVFTPIYRALEHARTRTVLSGLRKQRRSDASITSIALAFDQLQEARENADYNPEPFGFNREGTLTLIDLAERAVRTIDSLSADEKLALAVKLVVKPR